MTPNEIINKYILSRIIGWRHELEALDAEAVAELVKVLKSANSTLREKIEAELPKVWENYTPDKGGAAVRIWLGELLEDSAQQVNTTITEAWSISAQQSLAIYNDILSVGGLATSVETVPITLETIQDLASKKMFAGQSLSGLIGKAFTDGQVAAIVESLDNSIAHGYGYKKAIKDVLAKGVDTGAIVTQRDAITLARSYIQQASVNAQLAVYERNRDIVKGVKWCSILDNRVCPLCFPGTTEVIPIGRLRGVTKRPYVGDIITIATSGGKQISATPKHPILTPEGWCALEKLDPGDKIVYAEKGDVLNVLREQEINVPAEFSKLFDFFCSQSFAEVKRYRTSTDAFNGDSGILNSYIATIVKNSLLESNVGYPALAKFIPYKGFAFDNADLSFLPGNSSLDISFNRMRSWAFWLTSQFNSCFMQGTPDKIGIKTLLHDLFWGKTSLIQLNNFFSLFRFVCATHFFRNIWHSLVFDKKIGNSGSGNGKMFCNLTSGNSLSVHCENIVSIRREFQSRHVYNLHCDEELYVANGFVVKNCAATDGLKYTWDEERPPMPRHPRCRCLWLPWLPEWRELGIDIDELEKAARPWLIREPGNIDEGGNRKVLNFGTTTEDFDGWWKTLPYKEQIQSIGPIRTKLINEGKLSWKDLQNKNTGHYYTLKELGFTEGGKPLL